MRLPGNEFENEECLHNAFLHLQYSYQYLVLVNGKMLDLPQYHEQILAEMFDIAGDIREVIEEL